MAIIFNIIFFLIFLIDIQTTSIQPTGIFLKIRPNNTHGHFINIVDPSSKSWFERKIEEVINDYNNEKHHY